MIIYIHKYIEHDFITYTVHMSAGVGREYFRVVSTRSRVLGSVLYLR